MGYAPYNYKTAGALTRGATIWAAGTVPQPDDGEPMSAELTASLLERIFETLYYVGNGGVSSVYINGTTPNAGGYTPTSAIKVLGAFGIEVTTLTADQATAVNLGVSGTLSTTGPFIPIGDGAVSLWRTGTISSTTGQVIDDTRDEWKQTNGFVGDISHTVKSTSPIPQNGTRMVIWKDGTSAFEVELKREDASIIATLGTSWSSVTLTYYTVGTAWRLTNATNGVSLVGATP